MKMVRSGAWMVMAAGMMMPLRGQSQVLSMVSAMVGGQVKDDLFAGTEKFATGASDVTEVNLDPKMLGMLGKNTSNGLAKKMEFIVVHAYSYDKPGLYKMEDVEAYRKKLQDGNWNCFIHTKEKDGATDICVKQGADHETNEMVIMTAEPKELTFVHLRGKMTVDDLRSMGGSMGAGTSGSDPNAKVKKME